MSIRSLTFQVVAMMAIPAFAAYHEHTAYNFTFSSFAREGEITLRTEGEAKGMYTLGHELTETITWPNGHTSTLKTPLFDKQVSLDELVGEGGLLAGEALRPIAYIPQDITLESISIVTPGNVAPETLILTLGNEAGKTHTLTLAPAETPETITLYGKDANGTVGTRSGVVHTYNVDSGATITLNPGTEHPAFEVAFQSNDAGGQVQNHTVFCLDGEPFLRITGKATLQHHIFKINAAANPDHSNAQSLATLLAGDAFVHTFVDDPNTVIVVEFEGEGGGVSLDKEVLKSPIVFGSSVTPDKAHVHFPSTVKLESALTFRDGAAQGGVSIYGPTDTANYEAARWNPSAMLLRCDLTLCTPLPPLEGNWFLTHSTTIPAGRTFRLELDQPVGSEDNLPNLSFADATSRLELASDAASPEENPLGIPSKYQTLLCTQSGTLVLDRNVEARSGAFYATVQNLDTTLILTGDHTFDFGDFFTADDLSEYGQPFNFRSFTLIQESGKSDFGSQFSLNATERNVIRVEGGTSTIGGMRGFPANSTTVLDVADGATLTLDGLDAGTETDDGSGTLDLTVRGTLNLTGDVAMTPALRRTLTLAGGTIESTRNYPEVVHVTCADGGTADGEGLLDIVGGGKFTGSLTVDAAAGQGDLTLDAYATLKTLRDFAGTVSGEGRLEAIEGTLGDVTLGDTWLANATGKKLGDVLTGWTEDGTDYHGASGFSGTIGFTAGAETAVKTLDFSDLDELTSLGMAFRVANHQHIIMRLDQYADATIRWPDDPQGITLTLIESGAYGGELTLPHFPHTEGEDSGVTFQFAYFDPSAPLGYTVRTDGYSHTHTEDGVNDTLTWDNPVFTGKGAWIDIEFNGNTHNTGWFTLRDQNNENDLNGLLRGDGTDSSFADENGNVNENGDPRNNIMDNPANFSAVAHPADEHGGLALQYRPYVSFGSLDYPEEWSVAVRLTAPNQGNICLLALGNNTLVNANTKKTVNSIVFATGKTGNEIVCYRFTGTAAAADGAIEELFRVTLPDIQDTAHIFSVVCEGRELRLYMDGAWLNSTTLPPGWNLGCGLQVGAQLGAKGFAGNPNSGVDPGFWNRALPADKDTSGGVIDYLRFYKGVLTDVAMVEMADRTPAVRENLRYVRYVPISTAPDGFTKTVPTGGETWIQDGAWQAETWDGSAWTATGTYADEPAEGAYLRLLVAPGDHALQVNVERRVETTENGETTNKGCYFYSPNRNYAALVVEPQAGNTAAGTVRLIPYGVNPAGKGEGDALTQAIDEAVTGSAWYTTAAASTAANRTGFQYGKLRFTGGAYDPITDGDPTAEAFYGSAYLLGGTAVTVTGAEAPTDEEWNAIYEPGERITTGNPGNSGETEGTRTATITKTATLKYSADPSKAVSLIFDGGVCAFSKYADVVLPAVSTGTQTRVDTWTRTIGWYRIGSYVYRYYNDSDWDGPATQSIGTPTGKLTQGQAQVNTLQAVAGMALTRGVMDEVARWQLTGPVVVQGTAEPGRDYVLGHPELKTQDPNNDQASEDVWVPFFTANSTWKFYDDTRVEGGAENADGALGAGEVGEDATRGGLFARGVQTPGRLYLDFTVGTADGKAKPNTGDFSKQAWYRYGYEANQTTSTLSGMKPVRASADDFAQAVAFQIRLSEKTGDVTLTLDEVPKARVQTFHVEEEAGAQKALTLKLKRAEKVEALKVWKSVVAAARLDVSNNNTGVATATSWTGNALSLRPEDDASSHRTPVHRGNASHGHGAFIVGATEVDWDFGAASSVPRLEVIPGAELTFTVGQDFRRQDIGGITLVAQGKEKSTFPVEGSDDGPTPADLTSAARIHHRSAEPFLGQDVELGEGAIFGFHADAAASEADTQNEGVVLSGELRLTGNATLRADFESASGGAGAARLPHFVAAGGICATKQGLTLIVDAPTHQGGQGGAVDWHCHTATLTGEKDFRLWKTGPGTVTFYATTPPSVTGKVTVEEGTLAVTTAANTPVGAKGLHVKQGATLADSGRMSGANLRLALIPDRATLSGGGTVAGRLGLKGGATYIAKQGEKLTATGGIFTDDSLEADIAVALPGDYVAGTPYLVANRKERDVRRRLLPGKDGKRWDAIAWIDKAASTTSTTYAARSPQVPAPTDYEGYGEGSPTTITGTIEEPLINQYQNAGHAYIGATFGRTRAGNKKLKPTELSDALLCFTNISAFVPASKTQGTREYVDGTNFYVAYEFGISRQALVTIGNTKYVVLEVSVKSVFDDGVSFPGVGFSDAQRKFVADFNNSTLLSFKLLDDAGAATPLGEDGLKLPIEEVTGMDGATPVPDNAVATYAATPGVRWFRIPYARLLAAARDGNIRLRATATFPYAQRP